MTWYPASLWHSVFSLESFSCCTSPLRVSSWQSTMVLSLGSDTRAWALALCVPPSPMCTSMWATSQVEVLFRNKLCGEFSSFCLLGTFCCAPLWGSEVPSCPHLWRGFWVCENFLLHDSLPRVQVPVQKYFSLFLSSSFALPHSKEIDLHFRKSRVFC